MGELTVEEQLAAAQVEGESLTAENETLKMEKVGLQDENTNLQNELAELNAPGSEGREGLAARLKIAEDRAESLLAKNAELKDRISELEGT